VLGWIRKFTATAAELIQTNLSEEEEAKLREAGVPLLGGPDGRPQRGGDLRRRRPRTGGQDSVSKTLSPSLRRVTAPWSQLRSLQPPRRSLRA